jgi:hypothetical protein
VNPDSLQEVIVNTDPLQKVIGDVYNFGSGSY